MGSILDRKDETKTQAIVCQQLGKYLFCVWVLIGPVLSSDAFIWITEINGKNL